MLLRSLTPQAIKSTPAGQGVTLQQLVTLYKDAPERRQLSNKTKHVNEAAGRALGEVFGGSSEIATISRQDCRAAQALIIRLLSQGWRCVDRYEAGQVCEEYEGFDEADRRS
jgi:hypothetical protein